MVLIDEYDEPITDLLEEPEQAAEPMKTLKNFYGVLKSLDRHLHQVFITGVSKYGKVSIFSDLNNLLDVTLDPAFATLTGYTAEEVQYNGYSWDAVTSVYNPLTVC